MLLFFLRAHVIKINGTIIHCFYVRNDMAYPSIYP